MDYDFDIIVIGSGAGGGTLASECARLGKSVLLIERGPDRSVWRKDKPAEKLSTADEQEMLIEKRPYDDRLVEINGDSHRLYMGGTMGGSTSLFGAVLLRPSSGDFEPGKFYADRIPREIWEWPIAYEDLKPFYDRAERLYRLRCDHQNEFSPLHPPGSEAAADIMPLAPINQRLIKRNQLEGLSPFRLPLAIDAQKCLNCDACPGYVCPTGARRSSDQLVADAITQKKPIQVLPNTEVERFEFGTGGKVASVHTADRATRNKQSFRSRRYALAAGAIGSPGILMKSGFRHPHLGRNYMMHLSPIVAGVFLGPTNRGNHFIKQVGFSDFYYGTKACKHKMGLVQSLPVPGRLMMQKTGLKRLPSRLVHSLTRRMLALCGIIEDLPNPENHLSLDRQGKMSLRHRFSQFDKHRGTHLQNEMSRILRRAGAVFCAKREMPSKEHVAHQCGTLRFGQSPKHAVLDSDCRSFSSENLFVVDGSVLPTSLGVGPALTIMANSLRVASIIAKEV